MSSKISQKEYIKKYLSGDKKKKKKDKKPKVKATVKIIDDDMHVNNDLEIDEELLLTGEDAPQIVGIINASGEPPKSKWKSISSNTEEPKVDDDPWGKKADPIGKRDSSPKRNNLERDIDEFSFRKPRRRSSIQSPPRTKTAKSQNLRHNSPSEKRSRWKSPPRKTETTSDLSPPRKRSPARSRKDSDQSPPRKRSSSNRNQSPTRKRRNSDQSPPRRRAVISPTNIKREISSGQSPPRRSGGHSKVHADQSPTRRRRNSDQSPPRRHKNSDQSPPRRQKNSDQSPPRRNTLKTSDRFESSSRDQSHSQSRSSTNPFKASNKMDNSPPPSSQHNRYSDSPPPTHKSSKMTKTLDGKRAGLQDAQTLKNETEERRRNEDKMYSKMSKEVSGRDAEVQIRQSSYRRHRKYVEEDPEVQRKKAEHEEKKKEIYSRWNKGVKQIEAIHAKISDDQYEGSKPLARYSNDADLEEMLRQKERDDDPMLEYIRSKKKEQQVAANIPVMPKYKGLCPENRFNILPGYRWDGVDRSNGYEKKWFDVQSAKEAMAEEAYLYSVEDL